MDNLTKTLLTGAAVSALSVVPAIAGTTHSPILGLKPPGHAPKSMSKVGLIVKTSHGVVVLPGGLHQKSTNINPKTNMVTYTETLADYSYTEPTASWYKVKQDIAEGEVWYDTSFTSGTQNGVYTFHEKVFNAPGQMAKASKDSNAKISVHSNSTLKQHFTYTYTYSGIVEEKVYYSTDLTYYGPNYELKVKTSADSFEFNDVNKYTTTFTNSCGTHKTEYKGTARLNFALKFD